MARIRTNFVSGTLTSSIINTDTTISSTALASLPVVSAPDVAYLTLEPGTANAEIVQVTAHTASATTATVVRGQEGSTAVAHASGSTIVQAFIASDLGAGGHVHSGADITSGGPITLDSGTSSAPSFSFWGNTTVGMYRSGTNLGFATSGTAVLTIATTGLTVVGKVSANQQFGTSGTGLGAGVANSDFVASATRAATLGGSNVVANFAATGTITLTGATSGLTYTSIASLSPTFTNNTTGTTTNRPLTIAGFDVRYTLNGTGGAQNVYGVYLAPSVSLGWTVDTFSANYFDPSGVTATTVYGFRHNGSGAAGEQYGIYINDLNGTTAHGLYIASQTLAATNWSIQAGTAQSQHQGKLAIGGSTISTAPVYGLDLQGTAANMAALGMAVSTSGPTAPGSSAAGVISVYKGATNWYLLVTFNDAGTTRYRYMQLNGTTATWTHGTTLPT